MIPALEKTDIILGNERFYFVHCSCCGKEVAVKFPVDSSLSYIICCMTKKNWQFSGFNDLDAFCPMCSEAEECLA